MLDISLVIPTRNRAAQLADMLPHLQRLRTSASWEIVFVDNGSTDGTPEVLSGFEASRTNAKVVREPKIGAAAARNAGWRAASGRIVAFTDDDCYPTPDLLDQILLCFSQGQLGFVGGRVLRYDPADAVVSVQPRDYRVDIPPRSFVPPGFILSANLAFSRTALCRLDGFDEKLGTGGRVYGAEDDDIVARASALGITGASDPRPIVYHHHRRSTPEQVRALLTGFDFARGAFYTKMLLNRPTRGIYLWPALRRTAGNIWRCKFAMMSRELRGAWRYLVG